MREVRDHTIIRDPIDPRKTDPLELYNIPQFIFHCRLAGAMDITLLGAERA